MSGDGCRWQRDNTRPLKLKPDIRHLTPGPGTRDDLTAINTSGRLDISTILDESEVKASNRTICRRNWGYTKRVRCCKERSGAGQ